MTHHVYIPQDLPEKPASVKEKRRFNKTGMILLALLLVCLLVFALRVPILTRLADFLVATDTPLQKADLIFVLNGDYNTRPFYASDLYKQGLAPQVVIAQTESSPAERLGLEDNPTQIAVKVMLLKGIPADKILILNKNGPVTSTFDEAAALRSYIESHNIHSVILLTSLFHTRRARWVFEKELSGLPIRLEVAGAPHIGFNAGNWWNYEDGLICLNNEYIKLFFYWIKYR
jgi:uncharacterized SAM-binding protein YcdF (DUF218 family)